MDPVNLLVALVLEDYTVDESILLCYKAINLNFPAKTMFPLTIREEMQDIPILCSIVHKDGAYTVNPIIGLKERAAETLMRHCVKVLPFKSFPFTACHCAASMALEAPGVTQ